jgi:hypothetical protein
MTPTTPVAIYHWHVGQYWKCVAADCRRAQYQLSHPAPWTPTIRDIPIDSTARIRLAVYISIPHRPNTKPPGRAPATDFPTYVKNCTLPWEQSLLAHIHWEASPWQVMETIHALNPETDHLLMVSDGSSFEAMSMSFGVAIGTSTGKVLVENQGPACGTPSSHRAECTGCLSGALLLYHLQVYTSQQQPILTPVRVMSDNQGMITSLTDRATYQRVYPNATLKPDWDLLEEITATFSRCHIQSLTYQWVKGHQDSGITSTSGGGALKPDALFNIIADALAGEYHHNINSQSRPITPLMTTTQCILQINGASQHAQYPAVIRKATAETEFYKYLQRRHEWHPGTAKTVLWSAFQMAARTYNSSEVHLLKLVHDQLPTRQHLSRFQPWTEATCHH